MNWANRITLFRFFLTPLYCVLFYLGFMGPWNFSWVLIALWTVFILSEISDLADGFVARRFNQVTDLGKLMDPFADVIFRISYLFLFTLQGMIPWPAVLIILWREFTILFIRMMLIKDGEALAAGVLGKLKAAFYFLTGLGGQIYLSLSLKHSWHALTGRVVFWLGATSAFLALASLVHYLILFQKLRKKAD